MTDFIMKENPDTGMIVAKDAENNYINLNSRIIFRTGILDIYSIASSENSGGLLTHVVSEPTNWDEWTTIAEFRPNNDAELIIHLWDMESSARQYFGIE